MGFVIEDILAELQNAYEAETGQHVPFVYGETKRHEHETLSEEDGVTSLLENDTDRINALRDLYEANNLPAAGNTVDANSL